MPDELRSARRISRLAVAGGGTAGHVAPGLAVIAELRRQDSTAEAVFIGCEGGFEGRLVPARGVPFATIPGTPFARQGFAGKLLAAPNLLRGVRAARRILRERRIEVVLGLGGYASVGVVLAARTLGIPVAVHEANVVPGLANRLVGARVDLVLLGWEESAEAFPATPTRFTGNPLDSPLEDRPQPSERSLNQPAQLLVTGGSEGSPFLNQAAPDLAALLPDVRILHQSGQGQSDEVRARYRALNLDAQVTEFIDDLPAEFLRSDFVVATAGSITMAELAAAGTPSLHVPLSTAAESHQESNARAYAQSSGALWTSESNWNPQALAARIAPLMTDPAAWSQASAQKRQSAHPNAAAKILQSLTDLAATQKH